ncbi:MAG: hexitol phosphatase HxpB [Bacteroidetes bacterium]|nr:MAG: hexitol phosphatase HxpB [Bacteroidota bacterium]
MIDFSRYQAVIFDMDGVLIDSEPLWKIAMEEVFQQVGCPITRLDFQKTVGLRIDEVVSYWNVHRGWEGYSEKEVEHRIVQRMIELIHENGSPLPGVITTLHKLREREIKIGLATSSYAVLIDAVLNTLGIAELFEKTHSAEHEEFGKPHPAVYLTTAKELGVSPHKCLVIEDSFNGIVSALAAKMEVVCIPEKTHHPDPRLSVANFHFETMEDLAELIL